MNLSVYTFLLSKSSYQWNRIASRSFTFIRTCKNACLRSPAMESLDKIDFSLTHSRADFAGMVRSPNTRSMRAPFRFPELMHRIRCDAWSTLLTHAWSALPTLPTLAFSTMPWDNWSCVTTSYCLSISGRFFNFVARLLNLFRLPISLLRKGG